MLANPGDGRHRAYHQCRFSQPAGVATSAVSWSDKWTYDACNGLTMSCSLWTQTSTGFHHHPVLRVVGLFRLMMRRMYGARTVAGCSMAVTVSHCCGCTAAGAGTDCVAQSAATGGSSPAAMSRGVGRCSRKTTEVHTAMSPSALRYPCRRSMRRTYLGRGAESEAVAAPHPHRACTIT